MDGRAGGGGGGTSIRVFLFFCFPPFLGVLPIGGHARTSFDRLFGAS